MPRVVFSRDYIYTPTAERRVSTKFKASPEPRLVNQDCADKAVAAGAAKVVEVRKRTKADT